MKNNKPTESAAMSSVQLDAPLSHFLTVQAVTGPKRMPKRELVRGLILDGLKFRNIDVPPEIMNTI